jgi:hypothetical protein
VSDLLEGQSHAGHQIDAQGLGPSMTPDAGMVTQLLSVLGEAVEGPSGPSTYFIDNRPGAGLLGAVAGLSAAEASRAWAGTTIAAHVHHLAFGMAVSAAALEGDQEHHDWNESWRVTTVDDAAWARLVEQLRREYARLRRAVESRAASSEPAFGEAVGVIAHVAYHLGAIRQKVAALRAG